MRGRSSSKAAMTRASRTIALAALASAVLFASPSLAQTPPKLYDVRDFFRQPERSRFQLSPDGKHLSFQARDNGRLNVFVQALDARGAPIGAAKALTHESARDVAGSFWKGNAHIVFAKDTGGDENFHVLSVAIDGNSAATDLTPYEGVRAGIVDDLRDDDRHMLVTLNKRDKKAFDVFRIDVTTGDAQMIAENPGNVTRWLTDHAGKLRAAFVSDGNNSAILYRASEAAKFETVVTTDFREAVEPLFFTFDNQRLYVNSNRGRDKKAIFEFDPKTAKEGRLVYENPDVDVAGLDFSRKRKVLTEVDYVDWKPERKIIDPSTAAIFADLAAKLPGYQIDLQSATKDEARFIVATSSDRTQGARYVYVVKTKSLTKLGDLQPWLSEADMAPMKPISYTSRDGLTINGYLTLPVGREPKNLPVVINPHGGPWGRDTWFFNREVQMLANRGYAVLQMNFRGSTGYGRSFWQASFKQWGKTMQDDITDGVEWLKQQGIADPKRIAIYGASYGGYATLAGVTFTPDLYAAAVDYVGVANLTTFMTTIPPYWESIRQQLYTMVGDPVADKALLESASPVNFVDRIKTPLFVAQGARDPRVNKAESDQIVNALKQRGVSVEYMVKDNEGHGFRNEENQFDFYGAMEKFLAQHLKP
jgi:dipeptidyl aminopeptidase/acylaminoacyl peptidase